MDGECMDRLLIMCDTANRWTDAPEGVSSVGADVEIR
jgi:hypothetical protein